jgi:fructose-bisphosphate aldolase class II
MAVVSSAEYSEMLDRAKAKRFAYPAINVSSSQTLNAALAGLQEAGSDGILQVSTGGADYWSGPTVKEQGLGRTSFCSIRARGCQEFRDQGRPPHRPLCRRPAGWLCQAASGYLRRAGEGRWRGRIFNSHMWDGSAIDLDRNLEIAKELLAKSKNVGSILEIEVGAVGGEEDGVEGGMGEHLYTTVADGMQTVEALGLGENGRYLAALTFGNVHGVYKPGNVKLRPELLEEIQREVGSKYGKESPFDLVFHGGSGSTEKEIADAVSFGVIKMNIDTDTQYAFTRPIVPITCSKTMTAC